MDCNNRMCYDCKYVFNHISHKIFMERERIVDKILMKQNEMLYKRLTKIMMIHHKVAHEISLCSLSDEKNRSG